MNTITTYISHPSWAAISALALGLVIYFGRPKDTDPIDDQGLLSRLHDTLGLPVPKFATALLAVIWTGLFLIFLSGIVWTVLDALTRLPSAINDKGIADLRWSLLTVTAVTAALGAVVALPFTMARTTHSGRQTKTAEQGHITDQINTAVAGLGAEKTADRQRRNNAGNLLYEDGNNGKPVFKKPIFEKVTLPNIEVRIGAIYALERIAQDSDRDHVRIMEILCAYVRENSPANSADEHEFGSLLGLPKNLSEYKEQLLHHTYFSAISAIKKRHPTGESDQDPKTDGLLMKWSNNLPSPRADIEAVARVISRRSQRQFRVEQNWLTDRSERYLLFDLSSSNLQRLSFAGTAFSNTSFKGAFLDGASFDECTFAVCDFSASSGVSTSFYNSNFHDCNFSAANLEISNLNGGFSACSFQNADLGGVIANAATFLEVDFWEATFVAAQFERTHFDECRFINCDFSFIKGDSSSANNSIFSGINSFFHYAGNAKIDESLFFEVDLSELEFNERLLTNNIGDGSIILPDGYLAGKGVLEHWTSDELEWSELYKLWRAWQVEIGYRPPNDTP